VETCGAWHKHCGVFIRDCGIYGTIAEIAPTSNVKTIEAMALEY
jgi:hypothetical protein